MQVGKAIAVDVAGSGYAPARIVSVRHTALDDKAVLRGQPSQIHDLTGNSPFILLDGDRFAKAVRLAKHQISLAGTVATIVTVLGAPTMRSAKPSPLTSPAPDTLVPAKSSFRIALDDKAIPGGQAGPVPRTWRPPISLPKPEALPNTRRRPRRSIGAIHRRRHSYAPTMRSAKPSPLTSPAPDTLIARPVIDSRHPG